jgi:hypothetical protein
MDGNEKRLLASGLQRLIYGPPPLQELIRLAEPWQKLKARVMMMAPVDLLLTNGEWLPSPRYSHTTKKLIAEIDETVEGIIRRFFADLASGALHGGE